MPVFSQYPKASLPLTGEEVAILAQNGQTVNAPVSAIASGVLPPAPAPLLGSAGGSFTTIEPDNITIKIAGGVLSANAPPNSPLLGGTGTNYATVFPDGTTLQINTNELSAITNQANALLGLDSLGQAPLSTMKSLVLQAGTQSQSTVLVGPASGGSGPATWRQLTASDVSGVASVPASTPLVGSSGTDLQGVGIDSATLQITSNTLTPKTNAANGLVATDANNSISAQLAAPMIGGFTSIQRALDEITADTVSCIFATGNPDGVSDNAIALNELIVAMYNRGGGVIQIPNVNGNPFRLSVPLAIYPKVAIVSPGKNRTVLQLLNDANCDVVQTAFFQDLANGTYTGVPTDLQGGTYDAELRGFILDGNSSNQTSSNPDFQNGISWGGANVLIRDCCSQNIVGHGMRSFDSMGADPSSIPNYSSFTSKILRFQSKNVGRHGWWNNGPHDLDASVVVLINSSQSADRTYSGLLNDTNAVGRFDHIHPWNAVVSLTNVPAYGIHDVGGGSQYTRCHVEQSYQLVRLDGSYSEFVSSTFMNAAGPGGLNVTDNSALVEIHGNGNQIMACELDAACYTAAGNATNTQFGVAFGTINTETVGGNKIDCYMYHFDKIGPFSWIGDNGGNLVRGSGSTPGNSSGASLFSNTVRPNEANGSRVSYHQRVTVIDYETAPQAVLGAGGFSGWAQDAALGIGSTDLNSTRNSGQTATGAAAFVQGKNNTADAAGSWVTGVQGHSHGRNYAEIRSTGDINTIGDAQAGRQIIYGTTSTSGNRRLTTGGNTAATANNVLTIQNNSAMRVKFRMIAHSPSAAQPNGVQLDLASDLLFVQGVNAGTLIMYSAGSAAGSVTMTSTNADGVSGVTVTISPDTTLGAVNVTATGLPSTTIDWLCEQTWVEVL